MMGKISPLISPIKNPHWVSHPIPSPWCHDLTPLIQLRRSRQHHGAQGHHSGTAAGAAAAEHRDAAGRFGKRHGVAQHDAVGREGGFSTFRTTRIFFIPTVLGFS